MTFFLELGRRVLTFFQSGTQRRSLDNQQTVIHQLWLTGACVPRPEVANCKAALRPLPWLPS